MAERHSRRPPRGALTSVREVLAGYVQACCRCRSASPRCCCWRHSRRTRKPPALLTKADTERLAGMTGLAQHLHHVGGLRVGLDVVRTRDVLWTCTSPQLYDLLVTRRGWSLADYGDHVLDTLVAALLD